ncbi:Thymidylate kinase [Pirellulimonas nuda]|uniref:Thymidylate kinase n=1 Tax=Pirellulimonas nuda TaxID=2528009 RepID=A0A518DJ48_9BACT|nr:dTMP kinase [Pirellulimonas nuda]QDU91488.1 Thymidylate kinase [Pirellulimonas nuda]
MFFSFDGVDGAGKSTQLRLFCQWLRDQGRDVVECRDPGSTPLGERLREVLLHSGEETPIDRRAEMFLYMAARAQLVEQVIRPALEAGSVVVSDRYVLANIVYQAYAGGLGVETVRAVGEAAIAGVRPDCVFVLDLDPELADARIDRQRDRMEQAGAEFREKLRVGFLAEAALDPARLHVVSAAGAIEEVHAQIRQIASDSMASRRR